MLKCSSRVSPDIFIRLCCTSGSLSRLSLTVRATANLALGSIERNKEKKTFPTVPVFFKFSTELNVKHFLLLNHEKVQWEE